MFKHLLLPLDGSQMAEAVIPVAAFLAERAGARITLLHVLERDAVPTVHGQRHLTSAAEAEHYLREIVGSRFPSQLNVDWHVHGERIQYVAESVAEHAHELDPDLILMLIHGHRRLSHLLFGTIAQQTLRRTPCPVLLVQPDADGKVAVPFRRIVVPLDGQAEHETALLPAAAVARLCEAELRLMMVVPTRGAVGGEHLPAAQLLPAATDLMLEMAQEEGAEYLSRHLQCLQAGGTQSTATVARGDPLDVLRQQIQQQGADLVALGTHGTAGTEAFWSGSLGARLIGSVPASLLLVSAGNPSACCVSHK